MVTSVHLFVGAAIGKAVGNVYITIPVAMISHYLLDAIPHYNPKPVKSFRETGLGGANKKDLILKALEPLIGVSLLSFLIYLNNSPTPVMVIGGFFGWLPDLLTFLEWKYGINCCPILVRFEKTVHRHAPFVTGILSQAIILLLATIYILM